MKTDNKKKVASIVPNGKNLPAAPVPAARKLSSNPTKSGSAMRTPVAPMASEGPAPVAPEPDWRKTVVGAVLLVLAVGLVGYAVIMPGPGETRSAARVKQKEAQHIEELVNKHLVITNTRIEIEQRKKDLELKERLHHLGDTVHERPIEREPLGVDMSSDRHELNAINDLRGPSEDLNYQSPGTEIMRELADRQQTKAEEEAYNKAYRDAVIQEARRQGFELIFGPNGQILKAVPLRTNGNGLSK